MKKIIKNILIFLIPVTCLIYLIFSYNIVKTDFKYAHQSSMIYNQPFNWQKYFTFVEIHNFINKFKGQNNLLNLKKINIYLSEQKSKSLLDNTPKSTKKWVDAKMEYNKKNEFKDIKFRYRGDNPTNWLMDKKTFRIKTKKRDQINGYRYFDYLIYSGKIYLPYLISDKMNLINQKASLAQIFFNGESKGLFIEVNKIDENFLRRNSLMPVNIYKGENHTAEKRIGLNSNLFNNHGLWSKLAIFNQKSENDYTDLKLFLEALNKNKSKEDFLSLNYIDINYFSKFEAFLTLTQNLHHDWFHNLRLISDPWNGKITQLITDPNVDYKIGNYNFLLDFAANDLNSYLNLRTDFLHKKYEWLHHYTNKEDIVSDLENDFVKIKKDLDFIERSEPFSFKKLKHADEFKQLIIFLKKNKKEIITTLNKNEGSFWKESKKNFQIIVNGYGPLSNLKLKFNKDKPEWVGLDINYNNKIEEFEPKFFLDRESNTIDLPIIIYANRIEKSNKQSRINQDFKIYNTETKFNFISQGQKNPTRINSENYFTKEKFVLKKRKIHNAVKKNNNNFIIQMKPKKMPVKVFSGNIIVNNDLVINEPVEIKEGTTFLIKPKKHIIFKNKVIAKGEKNSPITFKKFNEQSGLNKNNKNIKPWGSIVLLGKKTKGSYIKNVHFKGGSGGWYNQYYFTSMFSIHDTEDVEIKESSFASNEIYDDTIHIVYSKNILLNNVKISNAFADAVDIDLSENIRIENLEVFSPKNDGIDFMESSAFVQNLRVYGSKDKAISVGENSNVMVRDSEFLNNEIGIAVKDKSKVKIYNSIFENNQYQIASYAKNWRYSGGGQVEAFKSKFLSKNQNKFISANDPGSSEDKKNNSLVQNSKIFIYDSMIEGKILTEGKNISVK